MCFTRTILIIWSRSQLLLLFWEKAVQVMRRCVYYIIYYIFGIGKNWFDIETIQRMYTRSFVRGVRKARILFSSFTVIYKNMYNHEWSIGNLFSIYSHYTFCVVGRLLPRLWGIDIYVYIYSFKVPFVFYLHILFITLLFQLERTLKRDSNDSLYIFKAIKD